MLYGSSAIGGVVNLVSDEIVTRPQDRIHGAFTVQGATADENAGIAGNVSGGTGRFAYRVNGSAQRTDDYDTPEGKVSCSHETDGDEACATKLLWTRVQGGVTKALSGTTLADLVEFARRRRSSASAA